MPYVDGDTEYRQLVRSYEEFFAPSDGDGEYLDSIRALVDSPPPRRLMVDLDDLRRHFGMHIVKLIMQNPIPTLRALEEAFKSTAPQ